MGNDAQKQKFFKAGNIIFSVFWILFGICVCIYDWIYYPYMTATTLGAGFLPFWLGVLISVMGALVLFLTLRKKEDVSKKTVPERTGVLHIVQFVIFCIIAVLITPFTGMTLAMCIFLIFTLHIIYKEPWWPSIKIAVGTAVCVWLFFDCIFNINFPTGFLGFI